MPSYYFKELWTPLRWFGIKLFHDDEGSLWIKWWASPEKIALRFLLTTKNLIRIATQKNLS